MHCRLLSMPIPLMSVDGKCEKLKEEIPDIFF